MTTRFETRVALTSDIAEALRQVKEREQQRLGVPLSLPQVVYLLCKHYLKENGG